MQSGDGTVYVYTFTPMNRLVISTDFSLWVFIQESVCDFHGSLAGYYLFSSLLNAYPRWPVADCSSRTMSSPQECPEKWPYEWNK